MSTPSVSFAPGTPDLGDFRLNQRQVRLMNRLVQNPEASLPDALRDGAEIEAGYRFLRNPKISLSAVLEPHINDVAAMKTTGARLIVHDSSKIVHVTAQDAADTYDLGTGRDGYIGHFSLVIQESDGEPLGLANLEIIAREKTDPATKASGAKVKKARRTAAQRARGPGPDDVVDPDVAESYRWARGALESAHRLGAETPLVHVMDSEGDSYFTYFALVSSNQDFVVRAAQDRIVRTDKGPTRDMLSKQESNLPVLLQRTIELSAREAKRALPAGKRNRGVRSERETTVDIHGGVVYLQRPKTGPKDWPEELKLSVVLVRETSLVAGEEPVEWTLWTTLPVTTAAEAARVVDIYVRRWLIEEFFKALKTGCKFEERHFESGATSQIALGLFIPIAIHLLRIRHFSRESPDRPAKDVLPPSYLAALRHLDRLLPTSPTVMQALLGIARCGGHLKQNGDPGWQVLWRGLQKVANFAEGWEAAIQTRGRVRDGELM